MSTNFDIIDIYCDFLLSGSRSAAHRSKRNQWILLNLSLFSFFFADLLWYFSIEQQCAVIIELIVTNLQIFWFYCFFRTKKNIIKSRKIGGKKWREGQSEKDWFDIWYILLYIFGCRSIRCCSHCQGEFFFLLTGMLFLSLCLPSDASQFSLRLFYVDFDKYAMQTHTPHLKQHKK